MPGPDQGNVPEEVSFINTQLLGRYAECIANGIREAYQNSDELSRKSFERSKIYDLGTFRGRMIDVYSKILE